MLIEDLSFTPNGRCPYLSGRNWSLLRMETDEISISEFENLLNIGFRKNGNIYYLPKCIGCEECRTIRVRVNEFIPSKKNKKLLKKNSDVKIIIGKPSFTKEKFDLYKKYLINKHNDNLNYDVEENYRFTFLKGDTYSKEMKYYLGNRLIGLSSLEVLNNIVSSVYFFYDTDFMDRSLGTFSILKEIEYTKSLGKDFLHLGFYVHNCPTMNYKIKFKPNDILYGNYFWVDGDDFLYNIKMSQPKNN